MDGKIPWRRKWQPTPVFLLGKSHGQRRLVSYIPRSRTEETGELYSKGLERVLHDLATKQQQSETK